VLKNLFAEHRPPFRPRPKAKRASRGNFKDKSDFLSKLVGKAELAGQIDAAKKQIYQSSDKFFAAQKDAYLSYLFCILIMQDKSLSTSDKLKALETYANSGKSKSEEETAHPDVTLRLAYPESPAVMLINLSDVVAREVKYWAAIWNLETKNTLPIPVATFDYIRAHEGGGPLAFFGLPNVQSLLNIGNRLAGFVGVTCPNCVTTHYYWVYVIWEEGGWFSELPNGKSPNLASLSKAIPVIAEDADRFFRDIPPETRIPITGTQ
jgi:hypothetical protein